MTHTENMTFEILL